MTSRERLDRLHKQQEVDRPGIFARGVGPSSPAHPSYRLLRELVCEKCDLKDVIYFGVYDAPGVSRRVEPYNCDYERHVTTLRTPMGDLTSIYMHGTAGLPGYTKKHFIETVGDARAYLSRKIPDFIFDPEDFFASNRKMGDRGIAVADIGLNPAGSVVDLMGSECFALWSIEERELLHTLIRNEQDALMRRVKRLLDNRIGPYFAMLGEEYITPPLHGAKDFYEFNVVYDKPVVELIHNAGGYMHIHCHGPVKEVLPYFIEIGADILHPIEPPPLGNVTPKEAKAVLKGKTCIEGNIQIGDMYTKNQDEIKEHILLLMEDYFDDSKGLIVCPTASPFIPEMSPEAYENYKVMIECVTGYGDNA